MVHVPPYGYASQDGSLSVQGVLSVTALSGPVGAGVPAKGSAAGGVRLTVSGSGFEPNATHMKVTLRLLTTPRTTPFTTLLIIPLTCHEGDPACHIERIDRPRGVHRAEQRASHTRVCHACNR